MKFTGIATLIFLSITAYAAPVLKASRSELDAQNADAESPETAHLWPANIGGLEVDSPEIAHLWPADNEGPRVDSPEIAHLWPGDEEEHDSALSQEQPHKSVKRGYGNQRDKDGNLLPKCKNIFEIILEAGHKCRVNS